MAIGEFQSESFGTCSLPSLPEDVFTVISRFLSPSDICNVSFCCKSLCDLVGCEEIWLAQCELVKVLPLSELLQWRTGISSYKALCRFLVEVMKPLVGIWVQQNPELGNVVYVMPGFLSVVGCRIIPQKVGPLGIQEGPVMWSPVFEIICGFDGSNKFFLHGRERKDSCLYPVFVTGIEKTCNVLHLEVEPRREKSLCSEDETEREETSRKVSFWDLILSDKKSLLELVTSHVGLHVPEPLIGKLFPTSKDDEKMLLERRTMLLKMHKFGGNWKHKNLEEEEEMCYNPTQVDIDLMLTALANDNKDIHSDDDDDDDDDGDDGDCGDGEDRESKTENLQSFLTSGDTFGLSLKACYTDIPSYLGWPGMSFNHFYLCKLPIKSPMNDQVYAGLWGGAFGWPSSGEDKGKSGKAFYLLMLTYEQSNKDSDKTLLLGRKILEGTDYVKHPNGSRMFAVDIDTPPSLEPFPFDGRDFEHSYKGDGIADGYGFRYPGSEPGSLFVISNDLLAFVWRETRDVFTLQRLNLEEILKKGSGVCVPPLSPAMNFTYMERSYINVFLESYE